MESLRTSIIIISFRNKNSFPGIQRTIVCHFSLHLIGSRFCAVVIIAAVVLVVIRNTIMGPSFHDTLSLRDNDG